MLRSKRLEYALVALSSLATLGAGGERPIRGGILHVALRAEPKTFNPVVAIDAPSRDVLRRIHADLISIDRSTQKTVPALAETWSRSSDGTRYTLKLRRGVRFSDGALFTADDVVFSWSVYLDERVHSPQRDLLMIDGQPIQCARKDDFTVEFVVSKPFAAAERLFDSVAILPRRRLETQWKAGNLRDAWAVGTAPAEVVGLGPFRLKEYRPGDAVLLERNPYYWRPAPEAGGNLPYLDGIAVTIAPLEFRSLLDRVLNTQQFDTALLGLGGGDADPNAEQNVWLSSGGMHLWNPNQKLPATDWEGEIDRLMKQQMVSLRPGERKKLYGRVQDIVAAQLPMIFLVGPSVVVAQRGNVGNFRPALLDHFTLWNASELFLRGRGTEAQ